MKDKFNFDLENFIKEKKAIRCKDESQAKELLEYFRSKGITWKNGLPINETYWKTYEGLSCYTVDNDGMAYCILHHFSERKYEIYHYEDLIFEEEETTMDFELKLFDIVEHENGAKQMVVSINEEKEFSHLDGGGNNFYPYGIHPLFRSWHTDGKIVQVWRPINRGEFGYFLKNGFDKEYFNLVWERNNHTIVIDGEKFLISNRVCNCIKEIIEKEK